MAWLMFLIKAVECNVFELLLLDKANRRWRLIGALVSTSSGTIRVHQEAIVWEDTSKNNGVSGWVCHPTDGLRANECKVPSH